MNPGPFRISLKVTDNIGMTGFSKTEDIPASQNYVPLNNPNPQPFCYPNGAGPNLTGVLVTVSDIYKNPPIQNVLVSFILGQNPYPATPFVFNPPFNQTDSSGTVWTNVTSGKGTIKVSYGTFPAIEVPVKGPNDPC